MGVEFCLLDEVREQLDWASSLRMDAEIADLIRLTTKRIYGSLLDRGSFGTRRARVISYGSTNPERRTYVVDPCDPAVFTCDLDYLVIIDDAAMANPDARAEIERKMLERTVRKEGALYPDMKHGKRRRNYPLGPVNLSLTLMGESEASGMPDLAYMQERLCFGPQDRTEARLLKLLFQRAGAYAGFNRGFTGTACETLIDECRTVEGCFDFLEDLAEHDAPALYNSTMAALGIEKNVVAGVSKNVWKRVVRMVDIYRSTGKVKAGPFGVQDWLELAEERRTRHGDKDFIATRWYTNCSPATPNCGVDPVDIRDAMLAAFPYKRGLDYYLVPRRALGDQGAHTEIYIGFALKKGDGAEEVFGKFSSGLLTDNGDVKNIVF